MASGVIGSGSSCGLTACKTAVAAAMAAAKSRPRIPIKVFHMGHSVPYGRALAVQEYLVRSQIEAAASSQSGASQQSAGVLLTVEHPPTYTAGRRIRGTDGTEGARLRSLGAAYVETQRGGQTTFHGPGQLVGYPILDLRRFGWSARVYVQMLEAMLVETCGRLGISATTTQDTGVWVDDRKIAALGIHISRYISSHGFAINCTTDLGWFEHIVPCGMQDKKATSVLEEMRRVEGGGSGREMDRSSVKSVREVVVGSFMDVFGVVEIERGEGKCEAKIRDLLGGRARDAPSE